MADTESFGRQAAALSDAASLLELEGKAGKASFFSDFEVLLGDVVSRALKAQATIRVEHARREDSVSILGLDGPREAILDELFALDHQRARGAWFHPEKASLKAGLANLSANFRTYPRFATGITLEDRARVRLESSPGAIFVWAVLEPFFERLWLPLMLRGNLVGTKEPDERKGAWAEARAFLSEMGLEVDRAIESMRYGSGWSGLRAAEQLEAKQRFLAAIELQADEDLAGRFRATSLLPLIQRYYAKAKNGQALRTKVLTRQLERVLAGFFAGDWSAFLDYLGEEQHSEERVATRIETELPITGANASISERVATLKSYWQVFDQIHSKQQQDMASLWGLVEDGGGIRGVLREADEEEADEDNDEAASRFNPLLYCDLLPSSLLEDIDRLWGTTMLPKFPERIVSEPSPHSLMADCLGSALRFWNGTGLTSWFVCASGLSRTDLAGLPGYFQDELKEFEDLGCAIDPAMFSELRDIEERWPPLELGMSITLSFGDEDKDEEEDEPPPRWADFSRLRDIITRYRQRWADQYLESFLRERWERELQDAAQFHARTLANKTKPPTPRQFAKKAADATNHWFGGDLSAAYEAIGLESPVLTSRASLMPLDRVGFAKFVVDRLGEHVGPRPRMNRYERLDMLERLAADSLDVVQLCEALDRQPELREFGTTRFKRAKDVLSSSVERAWEEYVLVVEEARLAFASANP